MRARTAAPGSLLSATLFFNATRLCSDSIWKGAALRGEPTGCGVQRLGGELGKDSAAETREGRSESGAGTAPAEPPGGGDGGGGHSAASQGMDAPSFDSLPPEKQVGRTPAVFWGHLGRAGEGGGRSAAVRSWAARLRAENRSAPFRQVMPARCGTSSVTLCAWGRRERRSLRLQPSPVPHPECQRLRVQPHFNVNCTKPPQMPRGS